MATRNHMEAEKARERKAFVIPKLVATLFIFFIGFCFAYGITTSLAFIALNVENETAGNIALYVVAALAATSSVIVAQDQIRTKTKHLRRLMFGSLATFGCLQMLAVLAYLVWEFAFR